MPPESESPQSESNLALANPWWIPPFFGRVPAGVTAAQLRMLGVIALALLFEYYDLNMASQALKYIREDFGLPQSEIGRLSAYFRLGALPAFFLIPFADRIGRRRLFLICVVGTSVATVATAFTQSIAQFIGVQILARTFLITGSAQAFVIVAEEYPADHRGWGMGILGALGATGVGLSALLFSQIDRLPYGWRALYIVGVVPLLLLPLFRSGIRETGRFLQEREKTGDPVGVLRGWIKPAAALVSRYPLRALSVALIGFLGAATTGPIFALAADYLLTDRGWTPGQFAAMFVIGGAFGILGNTVVGRLGDRFGRRLVGFTLFVALPILGFAFYRGSSWVVVLSWVPLVFATTGSGVIVRAFSTELFPTEARGTAAGWLQMLETLGAATSLWLITAYTPAGTSIATAVSIVVLAALLAALLILTLPETAGRELEQISENPPDPAQAKETR